MISEAEMTATVRLKPSPAVDTYSDRLAGVKGVRIVKYE